MRTHKDVVERALLPLWGLFIALVGILPLTNFVGHSHWEYIQWLPTGNQLRSWRFQFDIVANIVLFLPLGYLLSQAYPATTIRRSILLSAGIAGLLSLGIEGFQVYCHNRHPSPTDVVSNCTGSVIGAFLSICRRKYNVCPPSRPPTPSQPDRSLAP